MDIKTKLADLLFPEINETIESIEKKYKPRPNGQIITRFAPSPTGFLHIGGLESVLMDDIISHKNGGKLILRIEDTDQKREIKGASKVYVDILKRFGIKFDEGPIGENYEDIGEYGPYIQSKREYIYKTYIKHLIKLGIAYPCFLNENELEDIRNKQEGFKIPPGIYGKYSIWRDKSFDDVKSMIEKGNKFVIRLKSNGLIGKKIKLFDEIRGEIEMNENYIDIVILKSVGLPTYHFAHIIDEHLMGTTHVIRGDEWLPSLPLHIQMFEMLGFKSPKFLHYSPLLKIDGNSKRKISKRKDLEADVEFYFKQGYPKGAIIDYLCNIINSGYEDRREKNLDKSYIEFDFKIEKMNQAGALVDLSKLDNISTNYLSRLSVEQLYEEILTWAKSYNEILANLMILNKEYTINALNIERGTINDPKRFHKYSDSISQLMFFYDDEYSKIFVNRPTIPENIPDDTLEKFIKEYIEKLDLNLSKEEWFSQLKQIAWNYGFATTNQEFKSGKFVGKIGDIAMMLRIFLCGSKTTPDLYETLKVMGKDRVINRLKYAVL